MKPIVYSSDAATLDLFTEALKLIEAPSLAAFNASAGTLNGIKASAMQSQTTFLAGILAPSLDRVYETAYRVRVSRHLAATALAVRLYMLEHDGALPESLEALVPDYLPAVPIDSMDGKPLRYDPTRGVLWSTGADLVDNDGDSKSKHPDRGWDLWNAPDVVVALRPRARPATQASDSAAAP
jgi:hypothetical protein